MIGIQLNKMKILTWIRISTNIQYH